MQVNFDISPIALAGTPYTDEKGNHLTIGRTLAALLDQLAVKGEDRHKAAALARKCYQGGTQELTTDELDALRSLTDALGSNVLAVQILDALKAPVLVTE